MQSSRFTTAIRFGSWLPSLVLALVLATTAAVLAAEGDRRPSPPIGPAQVYFIAVGSEDFVFQKPRFAEGFAPVYSPENSAWRVASELLAAGAVHGILLTSDSKGQPWRRMVTRTDIAQALLDLKRKMRADGARTPRIVFYIMGHGLGDRVGRQLIMLPGNMVPLDASQSYIFKLQKRGIWHLDIVSSLVNFRTDPRMAYMDPIFPSEMMPNPFNFSDLMQAQQKVQEFEQIAGRNGQDGSFKNLRNPPVPFVVMFDNCYGGITDDLVKPSTLGGWLDRVVPDLLDSMLGNLEDDGLVLYAAQPGRPASDYPDPARPFDAFSRENLVGLLAARTILALGDRSRSEPLLFGEFRRLMVRPLPARRADGGENPALPHSVSDQAADVAITELIPRRPIGTGTLDRRYGTGSAVESCCR